MSNEEYRSSVYWGSGLEGKWYKVNIENQMRNDLRFKGSLMNFVRHCVRYTIDNDRTLKNVLRGREPQKGQ